MPDFIKDALKKLTAAGLKITPDIVVSGGKDGDGQSGLVQLMLAQFLQQQRKVGGAPLGGE